MSNNVFYWEIGRLLSVFKGVNQLSIDAKGRVALPVKYRDMLSSLCEGRLVATIDTQWKCLLIYPQPAWEIIEAELQALPALKPASRRLQRLLLGYASDLEFDGSGRVLLPQSLREYAGLVREEKLTLVGQGKRMELWNENTWQAENLVWLDEAKDDPMVADELASISL